ncbi:methyltransferase [Streptomyces sp. PR69]|uniref:methyltransferase n=1 Tax=Streptomyces sp. PR69 TaxID=2984950 RepID=UPI0022654E37|nr:methyltransferase [Streptomyces sp. PR69]
MTAHASEEAVHPGAVLAQAMAFQPARLVLTGIEIGLFSALAEQPDTEAGIRRRLGLHTRGTDHFLAALAELGFLECSASGVYANSRVAQRFLTPGDDAYLGGFLKVAGQVMYPAWDRLGEALRTGAPQAATYTGEDMFGELYESDEKKDGLVGMAEDASRPLIPALTESFDWAKRSSVLELGGCRGNVLAGLVKAHPHLDARVFDLPQLEGDFTAHMASIGMTGRVRYHGGDFFADPLPQADVLMIGHALVDWNDEQRLQLVKNTFAAVRPGGAFLVWDPVIVEDDESYLRNLIRSLNLQLMTPHGKGYRFEQCAEWMREAGYADVTRTSLGHDVTLVIARKE